ncbi:Acetyl esterase [Variovorax sp. PBL-H6]|uniref:alpha/beta hydrolase fold domain-containing protein n=1 Tax=Variovorax sp. PBL-H6 TaxID=434009 RepID=UPI0013167E5C|nr:alpha/beta hydrolase fold domain-containing protein [Variovorax sp. PBL-H6]VTU23252.1 Acetyl esterase [Variovorax sp. PBL-H6]
MRSDRSLPGEGYPRDFDPAMAAILERQRAAALREGPVVDRYELPFAEARAALIGERRRSHTGLPAMHAIDEESCRVEGRAVGLRWYRPTAQADASLIVYLHGGGWCVGSNDTHDTVLRHLAMASGMPVCGIEYSLAPEHPFPAATRDVRAVVDLLSTETRRHGGRLVLAGDSAGANLALVEAMRRRDEGASPDIAALLLFYGVYGPLSDRGSVAAYGGGEFGLSAKVQQRYLGAYVPKGADIGDPRIHPLLGRLDGLPPAWLLAAGLDMLLDDSVDLHRALQAAQVSAELRICPGVPHGFLNHAGALPAARHCLMEAGRFAVDA